MDNDEIKNQFNNTISRSNIKHKGFYNSIPLSARIKINGDDNVYKISYTVFNNKSLTIAGSKII
jgi:hypothetical protein